MNYLTETLANNVGWVVVDIAEILRPYPLAYVMPALIAAIDAPPGYGTFLVVIALVPRVAAGIVGQVHCFRSTFGQAAAAAFRRCS